MTEARRGWGRAAGPVAATALLLLAAVRPLTAQEPEPGSARSAVDAGAAPAAEEPGPAAALDGGEGLAGGAVDAETESLLRIITDAPCTVTVDGASVGTLVPGEVIEHPVGPGLRRVHATSVEFPTAALNQTVTVETAEGGGVALKMARQIRITLRNERQDWTFRDLKRDLMWPRRDNGSDVSWRHARRYCEDLKHGGFTEWRLPTIDELERLTAIWSLAPFKISGGIFLTGCCPWSSDREGDRAWNYNFRHKRRFSVPAAYSLDLRALCVHALQEWESEGDDAAPAGDGEGDPEAAASEKDAAGGEADPSPMGPLDDGPR